MIAKGRSVKGNFADHPVAAPIKSQLKYLAHHSHNEHEDRTGRTIFLESVIPSSVEEQLVRLWRIQASV